MKIQTQHTLHPMPTVVKLGVSRQVVIPKRIWHALKLRPGEYMQVQQHGAGLVLTPKTLVDKELEAGLTQSLKEFREGRAHGPFGTVDAMFDFLDRKRKKIRTSSHKA